ncbi:hypothetical protein SOVF_120220 [Spinacia oleracea]|nr:hypothetical protein SOVF_120220 [Spinacia oleracea]
MEEHQSSLPTTTPEHKEPNHLQRSREDYAKPKDKRARKLPSIFRSPFLVQYSHLLSGKEKDINRILDYAFCPDLDENEILYEDGVNMVNREYFKH